MRWSHLWSLALVFLPIAGVAQKGTTLNSGTASISVRVIYQHNHQAAPALKVELLSSYGGLTGGVVGVRTTGGNGIAVFDNISSGYYRVRVSGPDVETTTGDVIGAGEGPSVAENIQVRLTKAAEAGGPAIAPVVPEAAREEFQLGSKEMERQHYEEAKGHFQRAIALFPKYAEAFNGLALAEIELKDPKGAVEAFRSATQIDPALPRANLYLGQFYYDNHQYREAEPYFVRSAADQPQSAQILTALAYVQLRNGETNLALGNARKVSSLPNHKQYAISHLYVAQALAGRGKDHEIEREYKEYLKEAPDSPLAPRVKDALAQMKAK